MADERASRSTSPRRSPSEDAVGAPGDPERRRRSSASRRSSTRPAAESETDRRRGDVDRRGRRGRRRRRGPRVRRGDETPRVKPAIPGMDLEVDIVREGEEALGGRPRYSEDEDDEDDESDRRAARTSCRRRSPTRRSTSPPARATAPPASARPPSRASRSSPAPARTSSTASTLDEFFPRATLQRTIRQPLETVGYEDAHGRRRHDARRRRLRPGRRAAPRHLASALLEADPNLRSELKRRGFLTRDARVKERKKAGLKKARKRPQFSKR